MRKGASISDCGNYRYALWRIWNEGIDAAPLLVFIGLNPSTANAELDDPAIRRCIGFAKSWGYSGIIMLNLFSYRATDPKQLAKVDKKVGPDGDYWLQRFANTDHDVIYCWGNFPKYQWRINQVKNMLPKGKPIALTKGGFPRHPLYLRGELQNPHKN